MSDLQETICQTFAWCDGTHLTEDNSWFELSDGRIQCDHSRKAPFLTLQPNGLDIALIVSEFRSKAGVSYGEPEIAVYSQDVQLSPELVELLIHELSDLIELSNDTKSQLGGDGQVKTHV